MKQINLYSIFAIAGIFGCFILASCSRGDTKFLYLKPYVAVYDTLAGKELSPGNECMFNYHMFTVFLPVDEYKEAAILPFVTSAYATSIREPTPIPLEKIRNIDVVTLNDYDQSHPANTRMTDECIFTTNAYRAVGPNYIAPTQIVTRQELLSHLNEVYYRNSYGEIRSFSFSLKLPPSTAGAQQFVVNFETEEGSRFCDTTITFNFKP